MKTEKKKNRSHLMKIRLTEDELKALKNAKGDKGTLARYAREKLLSDTTHTERQQTVSEYTKLVFELNKIGTNINQIAYKLNKEDLTKVEVIVALRKELAAIRALANEKIEEVLK